MKKLIRKGIVFFFILRRRLAFKRKIARIYRSLQNKVKIPESDLQEHKKLWRQLGSSPDLRWYKVYASINNNLSHQYISEDHYYNIVELILNSRSFSEAYSDKNYYHKYIDNTLLPQVYIRNIQGVYYNEKYEVGNVVDMFDKIPGNTEKLILKKAIDSGGGKGVDLFQKVEGKWMNSDQEILSESYLFCKYRKNFIIQEYIQQHDFYKQFNESSVNTVRIFTYRSVSSNQVIPLQTVLRIGKIGHFVDNQASGGIACGVNPDGSLNSFAVSKKGEKLESYNGIEFSKIKKLFKYAEMLEIAIAIAREYNYHRLLGFDFCVDSFGQVKLIEVNNKNNEINFYQMNNGPLFKEYTHEIITYCKDRSPNLCFDFNL